jgi:hypothetical protein
MPPLDVTLGGRREKERWAKQDRMQTNSMRGGSRFKITHQTVIPRIDKSQHQQQQESVSFIQS